MAGVTRQVIYCIDPRRKIAYTMAFADVPDGNSSAKAFTCGVYPQSRGTGINVMQESIFLGTTSGVGKTYQALRDSLSQDGSSAIVGRAISHRIDPDARFDVERKRFVSQKQFLSISFNGDSPLKHGATLQYCIDSEPLTDGVVEWIDFEGDSDDTTLYFPRGAAKWIHLKLEDSTSRVGEIVMPAFVIEYETIAGRDGDET